MFAFVNFHKYTLTVCFPNHACGFVGWSTGETRTCAVCQPWASCKWPPGTASISWEVGPLTKGDYPQWCGRSMFNLCGKL